MWCLEESACMLTFFKANYSFQAEGSSKAISTTRGRDATSDKKETIGK